MELSLYPSANWHKLGMALNISADTLRTIETNYMNSYGVERCLSEALIWWYKNNPDGVWGDICTALYAVGSKVLAKKVASKHGKFVAILQSVSILNDLVLYT